MNRKLKDLKQRLAAKHVRLTPPEIAFEWDELIYLACVLKKAALDVPIMYEEAHARELLLKKIENALQITVAPIGSDHVRCNVCGYVFIGKTKENPPSTEEWKRHIAECPWPEKEYVDPGKDVLNEL